MVPSEIVQEEENNSQEITTTTNIETVVEESGLVFKDKEAILEYMKNNFTAEEIFEKFKEDQDSANQIVEKVVETVSFDKILSKYLESGLEASITSSNHYSLIKNVVSEISRIMNCNGIIRLKVLNQLSESHPEFLDHALMGNSTFSVLDKIGTEKITHHLTVKMNKEVILQFMANADLVVENSSGYHEILTKLFERTEKVEVFDIVHEFLRKLL